MRRTMVVGAAILAILAVIGIGVVAFNAGIDEGVSRQLASSGDTGQVVRVVGPGWGHGYGRGFGFPFGLILFPLLVIGIVLLVRGAFWRGRWGGPRWGGPAGFDDYHRRLHEQPPAPAGPGDAPGGSGSRETPTDPGTV